MASTDGSSIGVPLPHMQECIYLDYNATTPIWPEVSEAMSPFLFQHFGNPSSGHVYGQKCKAAVVEGRARVAALIGAQPDEIVFTSCGTESDNWAIYAAVMHARATGSSPSSPATTVPHVVASAVEHPAVLEHLKHMQQQGLLAYTLVGVDSEGLVSVEEVVEALTEDTVLVTVMHSNNEVGSVQPVRQIASAVKAKAPRVWVHTDAAQSMGKVSVDVGELGVDLLTLVGHKFGAPKGVAALYVRRGLQLPSFLHGGGQEGGRRAGTESVLLVVGLGAAAHVVAREAEALRAHLGEMRDRLQALLLAGLPQDRVRVNGPADPARRLPNTLSISIRGFNASAALAALSSQLAASAGSACHSHDGPTVSGVLKAMQVPVEYALGTLRLSVGRHTSAQEVEAAAALILEEVARQQGQA